MILNFKKRKKRADVRMARTAESTAFEIAVATVNIIMWVIIGVLWSRLPDVIPVHFDLTGNPDGYSGKWMLLLLGGIGSATAATTCFCAYHPGSSVNVPVEMKDIAQYALAARMVRVISLLMSLMFVAIVLSIGQPGLNVEIQAIGVINAFVVAILAVTVYYTVRIYRMR